MAEIAPFRAPIQQEDVAYRRTVSEAMLSKVGAETNFINTYQQDSYSWKLNGSFGVATNIDFYDGVTSLFYNTEIVGVSWWQADGLGGTTTFDIEWYGTDGLSNGSIFSTRPNITASGQKIGFKNLVTGTLVSPAGVNTPVFSKTTFNEGESLAMVLDGVMTEAFNGGVTIYYRPTN